MAHHRGQQRHRPRAGGPAARPRRHRHWHRPPRDSVDDLAWKYPGAFRRELLDVTGAAAVRATVDRGFAALGRIDVVVSNAGYGLFDVPRHQVGIEGFTESLAQEVARSASASPSWSPGRPHRVPLWQRLVADSLPAYDGTPAHSFRKMLYSANALAPGDPVCMAAAIIASAGQQPAPLRIILGLQALHTTVGVLRDRIADFEAQAGLAASTDFPPGE